MIGHSETITAAYTLLVGATSLAAYERPHVHVTAQRWELHSHNDHTHLDG